LEMLRSGVDIYHSRPLTQLEKQGFIKAFECTFELVWKVMKDFLAYHAYSDIIGSRDAIRQAFSLGLISDGKTWMEMIESRNLISHTYDKKSFEDMLTQIADVYYLLFVSLQEKIRERADKG